MSFEQTRDLLHRARDFHRTLSRYFKDQSSHLHQEKVKMLMDYLSLHEENLAKALELYEEDASPGILNTWFQYTPPPLIAHKLENLEIGDDMPFDEVIRQVMEFDDCLVTMYRSMAESAEIPEVKEVFESLLNTEDDERHRRMRSILFLQDI